MADLRDFTPEQLQEFLKRAKGDVSTLVPESPVPAAPVVSTIVEDERPSEPATPSMLDQVKAYFSGPAIQHSPVGIGLPSLEGYNANVAAGKPTNEQLTPEEQAKVDNFSQELQAKKILGQLPYQQNADQADRNSSLFDRVSSKYQQHAQELTSDTEKAKQSLGLGRAGQLAKPEMLRIPASAQSAPAPTESIMEGFAKAQQGANEGTLAGQLGKAGALIGSGIIGTTTLRPTETHDKIFDTNIAIAQQIPEQYKQKIEMSRQDPKSDISAAARGFIQQSLGITIPDNVSAQQLKEQFPVIEKMLQARENAQLRRDLAVEKEKDRSANKELAMQERRERNIEKDTMQLGKQVEQGLASSRNLLGKTAGIIRGAQAIETLASKFNPNDLTNTEIVEIAKSLDAMLAQGAPTITGTEKLIPKSARGDAAKLAQYISGIPKGADQGEFVKRLLSTVKREKELAQGQLKDMQKRIIGVGGQHLEKKAPEQYKKILDTYGLSEDTVGMHSQTPPTAAPVGPSNGDLVKIRDKKTGITKTLSRDNAQKYLANPGFEEVK